MFQRGPASEQRGRVHALPSGRQVVQGEPPGTGEGAPSAGVLPSVLNPLLGRAGGQADAAGGALAGRADPGDGDRVARMEPSQVDAELVGGTGGLPVDGGDDPAPPVTPAWVRGRRKLTRD